MEEFKSSGYDSIDTQVYSSFITSFEKTNFFQSYPYAKLNKEVLNYEPYIILLKENGKIKASLLIFKGFIPSFFMNGFLEEIALSLSKTIVPTLSWLDGPVSEIDSETHFFDLLDAYATKNSFLIKGAKLPFWIGQETLRYLTEKEYLIKENYTLTINLNKSIEEAKSALTKKGKKAIREANEKGVVVRLANSQQDIQNYYNLVLKHRNKLGFKTPSYEKFLKQWKILHDEFSCMDVFMAYLEEKLIASLGVIYYNGNAIEVMSGQSETNYRENLFAGDLIKWKIIEWGIEKGLRTYDLGGVNPNPTTEKEKSILQFKSKWGGELVKRYSISKNYTGIPFLGR